MTLEELFRKTRYFYTRRRKGWTTGAMYDPIYGYCVLGAMTAVATNNDEVESTIYPKMSTPNRDLIIKAARVLREALELYDHAGQWAPVWQWNDNSSRSQVIEGLKRAEKYAKERHL